MGYSEAEVTKWLQGNPDLRIVDDGTRNYLPPVRDNGARNHLSVNAAAQPKVKLSEHQLQCAIIAECDRRAVLWPAYGLLFAIPNGGQRHAAVAAKLKAEGVRAGIPDLLLPVQRRGYAGLFIELKVAGNKPTVFQQRWMSSLQAEGYLCKVVWDSVDEAVRLIEWYLEGK